MLFIRWSPFADASVCPALALVCVAILVARSMHVNEPYDNPAQHRKIRAKWRNRRRWCTVAAVCLVCALLNVTVVKAYDTREVVLSAPETYRLEGDAIYIATEDVNDGHLHRFEYTTERNVTIRWIVVRKPNAATYGVGLDACEVCGNAGYYERSGQVICKRCDVVMNINTIGFKGGCNPKVIEYSIADGYIIVPTSTLAEHESDFK